MLEVYGDGAREWADAVGRSLAARIEVTGETVFCYARDPAQALHSLEARPGVRYLHRPPTWKISS